MLSTIYTDITPLAINRTAMFHVVRDTLKILVDYGFKLECSALGVQISLEELAENNYLLSDEINQEVMSRLLACVSDLNAISLGQPSWDLDVAPQDGISLVFDPLYLRSLLSEKLTLHTFST